MQFEIKQKDLKAVSYAMAKKDIRYYLQGVFFETNGAETRLVATDGHRLHMVIHETKLLVSEPVSFIMPDDMVKKCISVKPTKGDNDPRIMITFDQGKISARLPDGSEIVQFATDGKFPDYRRIIPALDGNEPQVATFNTEYLADAIKGWCDYAELKKTMQPNIGIRPRGKDSGVFCLENYLAVVMPLRAEVSPMPAPKFAQELQKPVKLQAVA